jgi:hypothetical protein
MGAEAVGLLATQSGALLLISALAKPKSTPKEVFGMAVLPSAG